MYTQRKLIIENALLAAKKMSLSSVATMTKNKFSEQLKQALGTKQTPGCQSFDQAWGYFTDGTWGKCLKEIPIGY